MVLWRAGFTSLPSASSASSAVNFVPSGLHELDGRPIRITHINDALPSVRAGSQGLRLTGRLPTKWGNGAQNRVEIVDRKRNVHRPDIARSRMKLQAVRRRKILE